MCGWGGGRVRKNYEELRSRKEERVTVAAAAAVVAARGMIGEGGAAGEKEVRVVFLRVDGAGGGGEFFPPMYTN